MKAAFLFLGALLAPPAEADTGFGSFTDETSRFSEAFGAKHACVDEKTTKGDPAAGYGELYGCIAGTAETAKYFVNEDPSSPGEVLNVTVMWNDWSKDTG